MSGSHLQLADSPSWVPIAAAIVGASVAAVLAVITALFQDWRMRRNEEARQRQAIDDANRYMDLIEHALDTSRRVPESPENVSVEKWAIGALNQACANMPKPVKLSTRPRSQRVWRILRRALLITKPTSIRMAISQIFFYSLTVFCFIIVWVGLNDHTETWGDRLTGVAFIIAVYSLVAALTHHFASKGLRK